MDLRLFIALELPEQFLQELERDLASLRRSHPEFRWTHKENQHLTLAFLGNAPETSLPFLRSALEQSIRIWQETSGPSGAIPVAAEGIYTFPPRKPASVLAVGLGEGASPIQNLAAIVEEKLLAVKEAAQLTEYEASRRPFVPHITVARAGSSPIHLEPKERQIPLKARGQIGHVSLYSSLLQRGGPVYTLQGRFHL